MDRGRKMSIEERAKMLTMMMWMIMRAMRRERRDGVQIDTEDDDEGKARE